MFKKTLITAVAALAMMHGASWAGSPAELSDLKIAHVAYTADNADIIVVGWHISLPIRLRILECGLRIVKLSMSRVQNQKSEIRIPKSYWLHYSSASALYIIEGPVIVQIFHLNGVFLSG